MSAANGRASFPMRIVITPEVAEKEAQLVRLCPDEVFWVGMVKMAPSTQVIGTGEDKREFTTNYLYVYDIFVPEQEVSGSSVDWEHSMNDLLEELVMAGRGDEIENIHYFGHSHVNMGVFHSNVDIAQIWSFALDAELDWFISTVHNKKGERTQRFDQFAPFRLHVEEAEIVIPPPSEVSSWAQEQLELNVTKKVYQPKTTGHVMGYPQHPMAPKPFEDDRVFTYPLLRLIWPGDSLKNISLQIKEGKRFVIKDGEIMAVEDMKTHEVEFLNDEFQELFEREEQKAKANVASRSIGRSEAKRAEGNGEGEGKLPQTPTARTADASSASVSSGQSDVKLLESGDPLTSSERRRVVVIDGNEYESNMTQQQVDAVFAVLDEDDLEEEVIAEWFAGLASLSPEDYARHFAAHDY